MTELIDAKIAELQAEHTACMRELQGWSERKLKAEGALIVLGQLRGEMARAASAADEGAQG